jgi:hypothetical protein
MYFPGIVLEELKKKTETSVVIFGSNVGEVINVYGVVVGKPEEKRTLGRPSRRWEYNNKMDRIVLWRQLQRFGSDCETSSGL